MVMKKLVAALKERGLTYYAETGFGKGGGGARGLLSKYPIEETELINSWMFKGVCNVDGKRIAIYPSHSNYVYYSCYYRADITTAAETAVGKSYPTVRIPT